MPDRTPLESSGNALAWLFLALLALSGAWASPARADAVISVEAEETAFKVTLADGSVRRSPDLAGATFVIATAGAPMRLHIDAVERDPDARSGPVWLHTLSLEAPDRSRHPLCNPGPDGRRQGFPLVAQPNGNGTERADVFELVCTAGARAKCIRFGYVPWRSSSEGIAARDLHEACVRLVRADYGGEGRPWTRNGMRIDLYDDLGIQRPETTMPFEAGWGPEGAVCIAHPRVPENGSLAMIEAEHPRLAGRTGVEACTESTARARGAILFNRSSAR